MSEKELLELKKNDFKAFNAIMNPFPGLRPFGVEESHLFFGREGQSDEVLEKLSINKFTAILGTSGSGKSSLMYCGVIPILHGGFLAEAGSNWRIVVARPGVSPIDNLAEALLRKDHEYIQADEDGKLLKKTISASVLRTSSLGLVEAVRQLNKTENENFFILIDQFEELFRYNKVQNKLSEANESIAFVNLLLEAINQSEQPIYVAVTMRSDFIGECAQFPELTQKINDSHYLIPQMIREQKHQAIEGPVAVGGGKVSHRLVQQILNDVGDNPDQLPIMQHALMRTWSYWAENSVDFEEPMDLVHYDAIGRLADALNLHADEAYNELTKREQKVCEIMFKALTEAGAESSGIRRPTELGVIAKIAGVNSSEVVKVVDKFREPGRSLLMPPFGIKLSSDTVIDISHESLMRNWSRLKSWVEEEAASSRMYLKLADAARAYQEGKASLWKMPDLQLAINWQNDHNPTPVWGQRYHLAYERTMVFLQTSVEEYEKEKENRERLQRRKLKRARNIAIAAGLIGFIMIFLVVLAQTKATEAEKSRIQAEESAEEAKANALIAIQKEEEARLEAQRADSSARVAEVRRTEALQAQEEAQKERDNALQQEQIAQAEKLRAEQNERAANLATDQAKESALAAEKARKEAEQRRIEADRLRFQSIARSMAIKSEQIEDPQTKALVALQAYKFNTEYDGNFYDHDIYSGLYDALKAITSDTINELRGHTGTIRSLVYSNQEKAYFTAGGTGEILKWEGEDIKNWKNTVFKERPEGNKLLRIIQINNDGSKITSGYNSGKIEVLDARSGSVEELEAHSFIVKDIEFLDDASFVSLDTEGNLKQFKDGSFTDLISDQPLLNSVVLRPGTMVLYLGYKDGRIESFDVSNSEKAQMQIQMGSEGIEAMQFSHNGNILAIGENDGAVKVWDLKNGNTIADLKGDNSPITDIEFSYDDQLMAVSNQGLLANIYNLNNINELPISLDDFDDWAWSVSFTQDNDFLMTGSSDEVLRIWPTNMAVMADLFCDQLKRNMTDREWIQYVGDGIDYEETCPGLLKGSE
ncbi:MAG: High-affnity carbon uptake protein Hat/HatR [Bacteroidota bacterium]